MKLENTNNSEKSALDRFCINVTKQALEGKLDPVIGRHEEVRQVIHILSRRSKNNPLLIGEPGVGKTAIVEGIAQRIVNNDIPSMLSGAKIYSLDLGLLLGGTKFQGELEERIKSLLNEIDKSKDRIVLFIDEIHMIVGAGGVGSAMDASNLLKPALSRGQIHCIGATTLKEWKKYIEKDAALERRFQLVFIEEPSQEDAVSILRGLKHKYELHYGIKIKDTAIVSAVKLASQYITHRFLPDKAIDLIDEAAAMVKMAIDSHPPELDRLDRKIRQLEIEKVALSQESDKDSKKRLDELNNELSKISKEHDSLKKKWESEKKPLSEISKIKSEIEREQTLYQSAERDGNYERASKIKYGTLVNLKQQLEKLEKKREEGGQHLIKEVVDEIDIASVVSRWTGIPVNKLTKTESQKLKQLEFELLKKIIGQSHAVKEVAKSIKMHRLGLVDPNKPIGSFMFLGPTGVGKTETGRVLADVLFNDKNYLVRIDMSEYIEPHSVAKLIGSPPGYVGYEEGGQLTKVLRHRPYSVVLFDEFEKAHSSVWNIFLQILDDGHITDGQGRKIDMRQTIIIMTSNIGSDKIMKSNIVDNFVEDEVLREMKKVVSPELINRIDNIVVFKKLVKDDIAKIAEIHMEELVNRCSEKGISVRYGVNVINWLVENGYSSEFGARPLKRLIQREIFYKISDYILTESQSKTFSISIEIENDSVVIKKSNDILL
jgi:ATP-dependent Clp protease ATP-binding subunit ClpB